MDLVGCQMCALAGSGGAAVAGYLAGRCSALRRGRRSADRRSRGRTMRTWPGSGSRRSGGHQRADPGDDGTGGVAGGDGAP